MDDEGLGISDIGEVAGQLEAVDDLAGIGQRALDREREDASECALSQETSGNLMGWMRRKSNIGHRGDLGVLLEVSSSTRQHYKVDGCSGFHVLSKGKRVLAMPLSPQAEGFNALKEEESGEGVEGRADIAQQLDSDFDRESSSSDVHKLQSVVPFGWLGEAGELSRLGPVKLA